MGGLFVQPHYYLVALDHSQKYDIHVGEAFAHSQLLFVVYPLGAQSSLDNHRIDQAVVLSSPFARPTFPLNFGILGRFPYGKRDLIAQLPAMPLSGGVDLVLKVW